MKQCPACGGNAGILGTMGMIRHYLCQNCGIMFFNSKKVIKHAKK